MKFLELAKKRYSVRQYETRKVEPEKLREILEVGRLAPTAANKQPIRMIVVQEPEGLAKLKNGGANIYNAPLAIIVCGDAGAAWVNPISGKNLVEVDASIVTDQMMLAATDLELGTVWIGYFNPENIKKDFNLADNLEPVSILAIGYAAGEAKSPAGHPKARKALSEIVSYESY